MTWAARIVLLWMVCLAASPADVVSAAARSTPISGVGEGKGSGVSEAHSQALAAMRRLLDAGSYDEAEAAAKAMADGLGERNENRLGKALALDLWTEARWRNGKAWHPGTLEASRWSEQMKRELLGPESAAVADSLFIQARVLREWARFDEAREFYQEAIALYQHTLPVDDPRPAVAASGLAALLVELGQLRVARPHLERSLEVLERSLGPDDPAVATALIPMAWLEKHTRNLELAESLFERALALRSAALGPDHPLVAEPLDGLARLRYEMDDFVGARKAARRAIAIRTQALGPDHPYLTFPYVQLWWVVDPPETAECIERAKIIAEAGYPPNHPMLAVALTYHAMENAGNANYSLAWGEYERARRIFEESYGPEHWRVSTLLTNMSNLLSSLGEQDLAIEYLERSAELMERAEVRRFYSGTLWMLADFLDDAGHVEESKQPRQRALEELERERPPGIARAGMYESQANRLKFEGRLAEADEMYRQAVAAREAYGGPDHLHLMDTLREYADLRARRGDFDGARSLNDRALRILEDIYGPAHTQLQWSLAFSAELQWATGDLQGAFAMAKRLETMQQEFVRNAILGLPERQSVGVTSGELWGRDLMLSAAVAEPDAQLRATVCDALIRSRGLVLDTLTRRYRLARSADEPEIASLDRRVGLARERLARLMVGSGRSVDAQELQSQIAEARAEKERAELALAGSSRGYRVERQRRNAGLAEVSAALPSGSVLIAFARYGRFEPPRQGSTGAWPLMPEPSYAALVIRRDPAVTAIIDLGAAGPIEESVRALQGSVRTMAETPDRSERRAQADLRKLGDGLRRRVWDPLGPYTTDAERIFVVPDGALNLVPLGALPVGESRFLIEAAAPMHYLSAERDLVSDGVAGVRSSRRSLLAMGSPAFDEMNLFAALASEDSAVFQMAQREAQSGELVFRGERADCGELAALRFVELPASLEELESIGEFWDQIQASPEAVLLSGAEANETAFKRMARGHRVLHLATHGFFLGGSCRSDAATQPRSSRIENPLVLSGLALAGANHRQAAGSEEDDGILTAEEIAALDLGEVQWAVLSGCETGVGETLAGEGVFGLRRAFQMAGTRTVIMSLWPVEDESTRDWMQLLYRYRFSEGLSTVDSLHRASLELLTARRDAGLSTHPFYWAGFVASGDWR